MIIGECRECAQPLHAPVVVHCDPCGAPNVANAAADPALLALAKLDAGDHSQDGHAMGLWTSGIFDELVDALRAERDGGDA